MIEFIAFFLVFYIWHALGVTVGYHRLLSHRSFACPKWIEYFWVAGGYLAFEGSPIWWATIHRAHHRYADGPLDPHSPRNGLQGAHWGWLTHKGYPEHMQPALHSKDLIKDPVYAFLEQGGDWHRAHWVVFGLSIAFRLVIWLCFGWVAALASLLAGGAVLQIPLMLNVVCHLPKLGYKTYAGEDDSVNVWWVAILAMGEGWHNNHHASPGSAKTGMRPWELDVSWLVISTLKKLRLAWRVNEYSHEQLMAKFGPATAKVAAATNVPVATKVPVAPVAAKVLAAKVPLHKKPVAAYTPVTAKDLAAEAQSAEVQVELPVEQSPLLPIQMGPKLVRITHGTSTPAPVKRRAL